MQGLAPATWRRLSWASVAILWAAIVVTVISQLRVGYSKSSWQLSEWLINYRGGFVRRGLWGEGLLRLHDSFGVDPYVVVVVLCLVIYAAACGVGLWAASRSAIPYAIIPMSFALGFPAFANEWMRKDVLLVLLLGLALAAMRINSIWLRVILVNALAILAILSHEGFVFLGLPALLVGLAVVQRGDASWVQRAVRAFVALLPAIAIGALTYLSKGDPRVAQVVWASWDDVTFRAGGFAPPEIPGGGPQAAVESLGWTTYRGFEITKGALVKTDYGIPAFFAWCVTLVWVFVTAFALIASPRKSTASNEPVDEPQRSVPGLSMLAVAALLIAQFVCTLPLYVIGLDYGRWIFLWIGAVLAILITVPSSTIESLFGERGLGGAVQRYIVQRGWLSKFVVRPSRWIAKAPRHAPAFVVLSLVLAIPPAYWEAYPKLTPIYLLISGVRDLF